MPETIHVKSAAQQSGQRGPFVKVVSDTNDFYFCHDQALFDTLLKSKTIVAEVETQSNNGKTFRRITSLASSSNGTAPAGEPSDRDVRIGRQVALKAAVEVYCSRRTVRIDETTATIENIPTVDDAYAFVANLADMFVGWLDGTDPTAPF